MKSILFSLIAISPELILLLAAMTLWFLRTRSVVKQAMLPITVIGYGLAGVGLYLSQGTHFLCSPPFAWLSNDAYTLFLSALFLLTGFVISLLAVRYLKEHNKFRSEFFALVMLTILGMMLMVAAQNLLWLWIGLELVSLSICVLTGFSVHPSRSRLVMRKIFLLGVLSSTVFLFGTAYLYSSTGSLTYDGIRLWVSQQNQVVPFFAWSTSLLLVGLLSKGVALPFHLDISDAKDTTATPLTALLVIGGVVAWFGALTRMVVVCFYPGHCTWLNTLLMVISALFMIGGNIAALAQRDSKRLLLYFSIAHTGYLLLALATRSAWSIPAILFSLFSYTLVCLGAFSILFVFEHGNGQPLDIENYAGLSARYPILSICLTIFLLGMAGMPVTTGFIGKWLIFGSAIQIIQPPLLLLAIVGVLTSLLSLYYTMRLVYFMWMIPMHNRSLSTPKAFPVEQRLSAILATAVILFGIFPPISLVQQRLLHQSKSGQQATDTRTLPTHPTPQPNKRPPIVPSLILKKRLLPPQKNPHALTPTTQESKPKTPIARTFIPTTRTFKTQSSVRD